MEFGEKRRILSRSHYKLVVLAVNSSAAVILDGGEAKALVLYKLNPSLNSGLYLAEIKESIETLLECFVGFVVFKAQEGYLPLCFLLSRTNPSPLCPQLLLLWFSGKFNHVGSVHVIIKFSSYFL